MPSVLRQAQDERKRPNLLRLGNDSAHGYPYSQRKQKVAEHLPLATAWGHIVGTGSGQALPRHPRDIAYRCCRQALAGFTSLRRVGPGRQHHSLGHWPLRLA